ncbi:glutamine-hydrolyzing GMP synthase [Acetanaerobacterium sp. MSJ-12]|uniref:GMP synthase [glutamine-hydrolyzing] n=1 Tax=Bittarella massiliensis (ex Durand et al. 2017) TaxID=1720313 RepID=A0AAW5KFN0_9FIRM|nr:glutamine-hydrolyzing GMP synthase [Acetanaerobacterium sp. MSJ-12]MCQ4950155.1 glutamine-hydrolyzing GMP synthase [Bittarella massiliensis (ex Durand et al. 2017)]
MNLKHQLIYVIDFGGQYNQLIARRVRDLGVYCEVLPHTAPVEQIRAGNPSGIIFTGGPNSAYLPDSPQCDPALYQLGVPILGICYGAQMMAHMFGGKVEAAPVGEFGKTVCKVVGETPFFAGIQQESVVWMSHVDYISQPPAGFSVTAVTDNCPVAAMECPEKKLYAVQFHLEVNHTQQGSEMLHNFLFDICGCVGDWNMENYLDSEIARLKERIGGKKVLLALSGGVDSSVCAALLSRAIGKQLTCIFVDHGLMRYKEGDAIEETFGKMDVNFKRVNAQARFFGKLAGVTEPEAKRKAIGEEFIRVFEEEAKAIGKVDFLAQGTIYPDVVESGLGGESAVIKSHHNVGGLPEHVDFEDIVEPLNMLFKDEVRRLGILLGLPKEMVWRQPFPGPGLGIRVMGEVTPEKVDLLQKADFIFREELDKAGESSSLSQYFAVLTEQRTVGVVGDFRTYGYTLALRAVTTDDFMTADFARIPYDVLEKISTRIIGELPGIGRIVYDVTTKPPATIEWE